MSRKSLSLGVLAAFATLTALLLMDLYRPTGAIRLGMFSGLLLLAPVHFALGPIVLGLGFSVPTSIAASSLANGIIYSVAVKAASDLQRPKAARVLGFVGVVWGVPLALMVIASAA